MSLRSALGAAAALTLTVLALGVAPASADDDDPNWWYAGMHVDDARAEGLTGAGVKVGVVDTAINPDLALFDGARLAVSPGTSCAAGGEAVSTATDDGTLHGTSSVAMLLARPVGDRPMQGIAPDADVTFYSSGPRSCTQGPDGRSSIMEAVHRALRDGNRIISISQGQDYTPAPDAAVVAEALARGAVIVTSTPNTSLDYSLTSPHGYNGVVSVAAVGRNGSLQTESDGVTPVVTPSVTVVAPGIDIRNPGSSTGWEGSSLAHGSSISAPLVAGSLALLAQKYPTATGSQLIQALISSTAQAVAGQPRDAVSGYGYGAVSLRNLLATDPTALPDENPLMDKPLGVPTAAEVAAAAGGEPGESEEPATSAPSPAPDETDPVTAEPSSPGGAVQAAVPWLIGGGVGVLVIVVVVVIVVATRTRRPGQR